jgi:hypothetical protein
MQLSTLMSSQVLDRVATSFFSAPRVTRLLTTPAPKKQRQSEEYLFDVVQNIEGALYLGVAMPSSCHFLGCEFFSDTLLTNFHLRNTTIAPGVVGVSFNGTSMPLGRPSTMSDRPPYASNPNCSSPCFSLPFPPFLFLAHRLAKGANGKGRSMG